MRANPFMTTVSRGSIDGNTGVIGEGEHTSVSEFLTVQSLSNFPVVAAAISTTWGGLRVAWSGFDYYYTPAVFCLFYAVVSMVTSDLDRNHRVVISAAFVAVVNSMVLFSAVIGVSSVANAR